MTIRENINKIHIGLLNNFENVSIEEKSNRKFGNFFEISSIKEEMEVRMIITKKDVESNNIKWLYFSNPKDEESYLVERYSKIDNLTEDVSDVITKMRFSEEYLKQINKI